MIKKILFLSLGLGFFLKAGSPALATNPHFFLEPDSGSYNTAFKVAVKIDSGGKAVGGADILIEFPANLLKIEKIDSTNSSFPFVYPLIKNEQGQLRISAGFPIEQAEKSFTGDNGLIANINFFPLGKGNAQINFVCSPGQTTESNILEKASIQDVIVCNSNVNGSYMISSEEPTQPTSNPISSLEKTTLTSTPISTSTSTVPISGSIKQTISLLGLGIFCFLDGTIFIILKLKNVKNA